MIQSSMRNELVDILQSDLPNYNVYQRNVINIPNPYSNSLESTLANPIIINRQDFNINENYRQFTKQVSLNPSYSQLLESEKRQISSTQQDIPSFDIEYKGTRSLYSNKYKKCQDPMQKQLDLLKSSDVQTLRQSLYQTQHNSRTLHSQSTDRPISSNLYQSRQIAEVSNMPNYINSKSISFKDYPNPSTGFQNSYAGYSNNSQYQNNTSSFQNQYKYTSPKTNNVYQSMVFDNKINEQPKYSHFLLDSGERKVFTSEKKSPYTSQFLFNQQNFQENQNELLNLKGPTNLQTPHFQKTQIIDKPQVFRRSINTFY